MLAFERFTDSPKWQLVVMPAQGGPERIITLAERHWFTAGPDLAWTADGKWIITADRPVPDRPFALVAISVDAGHRIVLTSPPAGVYGDSTPVIAPDSKTLAFLRTSSPGVVAIYSCPIGPDFGGLLSGCKRITPRTSAIGSIAWSANSRELIFNTNSLQLRPELWRIAAAGGPPVPIHVSGRAGGRLTIDRHGNRLVFSDARWNGHLFRIELPESGAPPPTPLPIALSTFADVNPRVSPDGRKVAFTSSRSGFFEIWVAGADGQNPRQLTFLKGADAGCARWSPDGRWIAFDARSGGPAEIYVISAEGGGPRALTTARSEDMIPSWSPDGQWIYFTSNRGGPFQVWKMPAAGGTARQVTRGAARNVIPSRDGSYVYFNRDAQSGVWRVPADGGEEVQVIQEPMGILNFDVLPNGIIYAPAHPDSQTGDHLLKFFSFSAKAARIVAHFSTPVDVGLSASPDGHWLIFNAKGPTEADLMLVENFK